MKTIIGCCAVLFNTYFVIGQTIEQSMSRSQPVVTTITEGNENIIVPAENSSETKLTTSKNTKIEVTSSKMEAKTNEEETKESALTNKKIVE